MPETSGEIARRLAMRAEAVCRRYLPNGKRVGAYWIAGDVRGAKGRSLFVRLTGPSSGNGAAGKWSDASTGEHGDLLDLIAASCRFRSFDCAGDRPRPDDRHRDRDRRGLRNNGDFIMATIGTFTKTGDGYSGNVATLTLDANVQVRPAEKTSEKAPDFRIFAGRAEIGAAWKKTSNEKRDYLSVRLDDPSLAAPILANLCEMENGEYDLIWSRPNRRRSGD